MQLYSQQQEQHDGRGFDDAIREASSLCPRRAPLGELPGLWRWTNAGSEGNERPTRYQAGKHIANRARDCRVTVFPRIAKADVAWRGGRGKRQNLWHHADLRENAVRIRGLWGQGRVDALAMTCAQVNKGAVILGRSRSEFLDVLSRYRVSPFQSDEEEFGEGRVRG